MEESAVLSPKLTEKQKAFVEEYLVDLNATQAAIRAGYSQKTARKIGNENLTKPDIQQAIAEAKKERSERTKVNADWLLKRLADEAEADLADLYNDEGGLKPVHQWPKIWRQGLVAGVEVEQRWAYIDGEKEPDGVVVKVKLSDRVKRLELIGKHIDVQAFKDQIQLPSEGVTVVVNRPGGN